jgi:hypothetical protein
MLSGCRTVVPVAPTPPQSQAQPAQGQAQAAPVAPVAAGLTYSAGKATQEFAYPAAAVQAAITNAMTDLQIKNLRERRDGQAWIFQGLTKDNRPANVTFRPGNGAARVTARIGWFGDEPFSKALLERVGIRLGSLPPKAIPEEPPSSPAPNPFFSRRAVPDSTMLREQAELHFLFKDTPVPMD